MGKQTKYTLTQYPEVSRPVLTKTSYAELQSTISRLYTIEKVRKIHLDHDVMIQTIKEAYFVKNCNN